MTASEDHSYRWTVSEYVLRHELDETIRELLVEGRTDQTFFADALDRYGIDDVEVLDADYIDVSSDAVEAAGFPNGAKGRLMTVALELCRRQRDEGFNAEIVIVVDRDLDEAPREAVADCVILTDGYSLESYALNERTLDRFARMGLGRGDTPTGAEGSPPARGGTCSGRDMLLRVLPACIEIAATRRAVRSLTTHTAMFDRWIDYFRVEQDGTVAPRSLALLQNVLAQAPVAAVGEPEAVLADERRVVAEDPFRNVRGKDFIALLFKTLKSPWGRRATAFNFARIDDATFRRWIMMSIPPQDIDGQPLFVRLRERFVN